MAQIPFGLRKPLSGIGVDLGSAGVKAVELGWDRDGPFLVGAGREQIPPGVVSDGVTSDPDAVGEALGRLLARIGARTREVAVAVGGNSVFIRRLPPPADDPAAPGFRDAVAREAARHVPLHIESLEFDWVASPPKAPAASGEAVPGDSGDGSAESGPPAAIVFGAAPREMVRAHCDAVTRCGRQTTRVDLEPYALFAAARLAGATSRSGPDPAPPRPVAFVEVGARRASVHVFGGPPGGVEDDDPGDLLASVEARPGGPGAPLAPGVPRTDRSAEAAPIVAAFREGLREAGVRSAWRTWVCGGAPLPRGARAALRDAGGGGLSALEPLAALRKGSPDPKESDPELPPDGPAFAIAAGLAFIQVRAAVRSRRGSP